MLSVANVSEFLKIWWCLPVSCNYIKITIMIIKAILWPIKKILLFPLKILFYGPRFYLVVSVLFFQYRADYEVDVSPLSVAEYENCLNVIDDYDVTIDLLSQYVEKLDSQQQSFLYSYLPDPFSVLTKPQEISEEDFQKCQNISKELLTSWKVPWYWRKGSSSPSSKFMQRWIKLNLQYLHSLT